MDFVEEIMLPHKELRDETRRLPDKAEKGRES
jgi:hypothetical protein